MSAASHEDLKFFLVHQVQSFAAPLLSTLLDQKDQAEQGLLMGACRKQLVQVTSAALKNEPWALKMFDSNGRLGSGMASGSLFNLLGHYEQCTDHANYSTSFCLAQLDLGSRQALPFAEPGPQQLDQQSRQLISFGFCAPSVCTANNLTLIARQLLSSAGQWLSPLSLDRIDCHRVADSAGVWRTSSIVSILILMVAFVGSTVATIFHETTTTTRAATKERSSTNKANHWDARRFATFSIGQSARKLMRKRKQQSLAGKSLAAIDGLRVISTIWIILIHSYNFAFQWLRFDNLLEVQSVYQSIWLQWIANGTFAIDNFFLISGFLAHLKQQHQQHQVNRQARVARSSGQSDSNQVGGSQSLAEATLESIARRYLRLVPTLLVVILFSVALFPSLDYLSFNMSQTRIMFSDWCENNWILNAALLQNWIRSPNQCFGHTWFIAADFQLTLIIQTLLYLLSGLAQATPEVPILFRPATIALATCLVIGQSLSAALIYWNHLQAMPVIPAESLDKLNEYFRLIYIKPYYWCSSYVIGMLLAMFVLEQSHKRSPSAKSLAGHQRLLRYLASLGPIALGTLILVSLLPYFYGRRMSDLSAALYALLVRPLWSSSVATLMYLIICQPNRDFVVRTLRYILSIRLWLPLSRLSYVAYLVHPALMAIFYGSSTSVFRYSSLLFAYFAMGNIVLTFVVAFVFHLFLEVPLQTIMLLVSGKMSRILSRHMLFGKASKRKQSKSCIVALRGSPIARRTIG